MKKFIFISVSILDYFVPLYLASQWMRLIRTLFKDGPIMYLTRLSKDSITVRNGWERVLISFPIVKDGRSTKIALALIKVILSDMSWPKIRRTDITFREYAGGVYQFFPPGWKMMS